MFYVFVCRGGYLKTSVHKDQQTPRELVDGTIVDSPLLETATRVKSAAIPAMSASLVTPSPTLQFPKRQHAENLQVVEYRQADGGAAESSVFDKEVHTARAAFNHVLNKVLHRHIVVTPQKSMHRVGDYTETKLMAQQVHAPTRGCDVDGLIDEAIALQKPLTAKHQGIGTSVEIGKANRKATLTAVHPVEKATSTAP